MNIQLINREFNSNNDIELITQIVHKKTKYHENNTNKHSNEEDVITRESKIKQLQKELFKLRKTINSKTNRVKAEAIIKIELE